MNSTAPPSLQHLTADTSVWRVPMIRELALRYLRTRVAPNYSLGAQLLKVIEARSRLADPALAHP